MFVKPRAATLLRELREEIADAPTQKPNIKAVTI